MVSAGCAIALVYACFILLFNEVCLVAKGGVLRAQMREEEPRDADGCGGRRGVGELDRKKQ